VADPNLKHVLRELGPAAREFYRRLGEGELATTWCPGCERHRFPPRERCPDCGAAAEWRALSGRGRVYAFTQQERALRFTAPDVLGIVELDEGVRVFGVFEDAFERLELDAAVDVAPRPDPAGLTLLAFRLRP
jgi:uncharacterized OB-fold protein